MATRRFRKNRRQRKTNRKNRRYRGGTGFTIVGNEQPPHIAGNIVKRTDAPFNRFIEQNGLDFADATWADGKMIRNSRVPAIQARVYATNDFGGFYIEGTHGALAEIELDKEKGLLTVANYTCIPPKQGPVLGR